MIIGYRLSVDAETDIAIARRWYDHRSPGLGRLFVEETYRTVQRAMRFPLGYPKVRGPIRRALMTRFPYAVAYLFENDEVVVLAVLHQRQSPARIAERSGDN